MAACLRHLPGPLYLHLAPRYHLSRLALLRLVQPTRTVHFQTEPMIHILRCGRRWWRYLFRWAVIYWHPWPICFYFFFFRITSFDVATHFIFPVFIFSPVSGLFFIYFYPFMIPYYSPTVFFYYNFFSSAVFKFNMPKKPKLKFHKRTQKHERKHKNNKKKQTTNMNMHMTNPFWVFKSTTSTLGMAETGEVFEVLFWFLAVFFSACIFKGWIYMSVNLLFIYYLFI